MFSDNYTMNLDIKKHSSLSLGSKKKIKTEIANYLQGSKNENTLTTNLWDIAEVIFVDEIHSCKWYLY